ncbi:MAG: hypothetical protein ABI960_07475 [Candidatus Eisenbacteria bacterium]
MNPSPWKGGALIGGFVALLLGFAAAPSDAAPAPSTAWSWRPLGAEASPAPAPNDTILVTATQPYLGIAGQGRGYVYLAPGHATLVNPILVVEGFDIDNTMGWNELYALLDQQSLIEDARARGYDAVVLDFQDATDYIQRNGFVFTALLGEVESRIAPGQTIAVVGASMGGLVARYGLAWLETQGFPHRVRTFLSYDAPMRGANIPLGLQYWVDFFSGQSADAAYFRDRLNTPAARQMLVYHFTKPATSTPAADPLRAGLVADLAAVGDYPTHLRRVAFSNGSGSALDQGYGAGAQLIAYTYSNFIVGIVGNVWAVPAAGADTVFDGRIRITFVSDTKQTVIVNGTLPYDSAPGGWRASLAQLDTTQAPYGDIVALHPAHCFVPTVSALDLPTSNLFLNVAGTPNAVSQTPFHAIYWAPTNEEHVNISAQEAQWVLDEIGHPVVAVSGPFQAASSHVAFLGAAPNPGTGAMRLTFAATGDGDTDVRVIALGGRIVRTLRAAPGAGTRTLVWDGLDDRGSRVPAGLYFVRVAQGGAVANGRVVRVE